MKHVSSPVILLFACLPAKLIAQGDSCTTALPISPGTYTADGPSTGGGASQAPAVNADWYTWQADVDGYVTVASCGGGVDTRVHLYQGSCGGLLQAGSDDNGCPGGGGASLLANIGVVAGTTYFIEWDDAHSMDGFSWTFYQHTCPSPIPSLLSGPGSITLDWPLLAEGSAYTIEYGPNGFEPGTGSILTGVQGENGPPVTIVGLNGDLEYAFYIAIDCGSGDLAPFTGPWLGIAGPTDPPANDDCESGIPITCGSTTQGSTLFALADGPPECGTTVSASGIWYTFTGISGTVILSTCADHDYDTKLNVYTGACDDPECIDGNDDGAYGCDFGSEVIMQADEATVYNVLVQGYDGAVGDFNLAMSCAACPPSSEIVVTPADLLAYLDWTPTTPDGTFTVEYGLAGFAPGSGTVITGTVGVDGPSVTIPGLDLNTDYAVYLTETCPGGEDGYRRGPIAFTTLEEPLPVNALCGGAVPLSCGQEASGNTELGVLADAPECGSGYLSTPGLWYTFTGDGTDVTLSTCNDAAFDTKISIWSGTCSDLICEGGVDDALGCADNTSSVTIATTSGTVYLAHVHGYDGEVGAFTLTMTCAPACSPAIMNDACSTAEVIQPQLPGACVPTNGTTVCAYSSAAPNPVCDPYSAAFDVWYTFNTGPAPDHTLTVATISSGLLGVALYAGCGPQNFVDCYDATEGPVALNGLDTNTVYYVQIWNEGGEDAGTFTICDEAAGIVGVHEHSGSGSVSVWPNPVENILTIDGLPLGTERLCLRDAQGRLLLVQRIGQASRQTMDLSALAPGSYTVHAEGVAPQVLRIVRK